MKNRALIGVSAAAMSALVVTAVGCGQPTNAPYKPASESAASASAEKTAATSSSAEKASTSEAASSAKTEAASASSSSAADNKVEVMNAPSGSYADGEYTGSAKGMESTIEVTVTVEGGKITDVKADGQETEGIGSKALEQLPGAIVEANGTSGVEAVSGASVTSKAILSAVDEALASAKGGSEAATSASADASEAATSKDESAVAELSAARSAEGDSTINTHKPTDVASPATYADGEYTGEAKGMESTIKVTVTVKGGVIAEVTADGQETQGIGSKALDQLPAKVVEANGVDGVDAVSGATVTSDAIFSAVQAALEGAQETSASNQTETATDASKAGDSAKKSDIAKSNAATVATDHASATIDKTGSAKAEAPAASAKADKSVPADAATSAIDAVNASAGSAAAATSYADGTYEGSAKGIAGQVPVTVTVKGGVITDVSVGSNSETQGIGTNAIEQLPAKIVEANGTAGVEAVSGASVTSKAIIEAVNQALESAGATPKAGQAESAELEVAASSVKVDASKAGDSAKKSDIAKSNAAAISENHESATIDKTASAAVEKAASAKAETSAASDKAAASSKSDAAASAKASSSKADASASAKAETSAASDKATASSKSDASAKAASAKSDAKAASSAAEKAEATAATGSYSDGTYEGSAKGMESTIKVTVTVKDGKISDVKAEGQETQGIGSKALEQLPAKIVEANGTDGVDAVSGATVTSKAIFSATDQALESAKGGSTSTASTAVAEKSAKAESSSASEKSAASDKAAASSKSDAAASAKASSSKSDAAASAKSETKAASSKSASAKSETKAAEKSAASDKAAASSKSDASSKAASSKSEAKASSSKSDAAASTKSEAKASSADGEIKAASAKKESASSSKDAKASSKADKSAKADSSKSDAAGALKDGEFTGEAKGMESTIKVTVTVKDGKVSDVKAEGQETQGIGSKALEQLPAKIVEANGTDGVDAVSGATVTSKAIFKAVDEALGL